MAKKNDFNFKEFSEEAKHEYRQMLTSKNNGDDCISTSQLEECLEMFGLQPSRKDLEFLKKHMDVDGDGHLEVDELIDNLDVVNFHCFYGDELMAQFKAIDYDGDGSIRMPEMLRYLTTHEKSPMSPADARQLLDDMARKYDENFDGKFNYPEFVKIYMSDMLPFKDALANEREKKKTPEKKVTSSKSAKSATSSSDKSSVAKKQ